MTGRKHSMEILFPVLLFCIFTFCAVAVILFSARIYQHSVENTQQNYSTGTALSYLSEKIRRSDAEGSVTVGTFAGTDALLLRESLNSEEFETCIYLYDGVLRELYMKSGAEIDPEAGSEIMELDAFTAEALSGHLLRLTVTDTEGNTRTELVAFRSAQAA